MALQITGAELVGASDLDLGASPWRVVDQRRVDAFADATDDQQWIHVDPERAATGPFGGTIAHGYLTLSLVPAMLKELLTITDHGRGTNYGLERVRFTSPVRVGSEIRLAASIKDGRRRDDGGVQYRVALAIQVRGQDRPAMVAESIYLTYPAESFAR
ncbi:MaoC family dehydratase [Frankia sp. CH37]|nr:MaoC family dehydratase [Parafrankia sp. CH37]